eukprot:652183-Amphidinium_carterae.1
MSRAHVPQQPTAGSVGELLQHLQNTGLREAFPPAISARVRSLEDLSKAIRAGDPVIRSMAKATRLDCHAFCHRVGLGSHRA